MSQKNDNNTLVVGLVAGVVLVLGFLAAVVGLEVAGRDPDAVLYLLSAVLVPTGVSVFNTLITRRVDSKVQTLAETVERVETQTNGTTTRLMDAAGIPRSENAPDA